METVVVIKLISGEDVIGKLVEDRTDEVVLTLNDARYIMPTEKGIGLMPIMIANPEAQLSINRSAIAINEITVVAELEKAYLSQTSGLDLRMMR